MRTLKGRIPGLLPALPLRCKGRLNKGYPLPSLSPEGPQLKILAAQFPLQRDSRSARVSIPGRSAHTPPPPLASSATRFCSRSLPKVSLSAGRPGRGSTLGRPEMRAQNLGTRFRGSHSCPRRRAGSDRCDPELKRRESGTPGGACRRAREAEAVRSLQAAPSGHLRRPRLRARTPRPSLCFRTRGAAEPRAGRGPKPGALQRDGLCRAARAC